MSISLLSNSEQKPVNILLSGLSKDSSRGINLPLFVQHRAQCCKTRPLDIRPPLSPLVAMRDSGIQESTSTVRRLPLVHPHLKPMAVKCCKFLDHSDPCLEVHLNNLYSTVATPEYDSSFQTVPAIQLHNILENDTNSGQSGSRHSGWPQAGLRHQEHCPKSQDAITESGWYTGIRSVEEEFLSKDAFSHGSSDMLAQLDVFERSEDKDQRNSSNVHLLPPVWDGHNISVCIANGCDNNLSMCGTSPFCSACLDYMKCKGFIRIGGQKRPPVNNKKTFQKYCTCRCPSGKNGSLTSDDDEDSELEDGSKDMVGKETYRNSAGLNDLNGKFDTRRNFDLSYINIAYDYG